MNRFSDINREAVGCIVLLAFFVLLMLAFLQINATKDSYKEYYEVNQEAKKMLSDHCNEELQINTYKAIRLNGR